MTGQPTGGKPSNLSQLEQELYAASVTINQMGIGLTDDLVYTYSNGEPVDFRSGERATVDTVIANHVAMRDKTDEEYATEFQATTDPVRKQQIRDEQSNLLPREQVPMT